MIRVKRVYDPPERAGWQTIPGGPTLASWTGCSSSSTALRCRGRCGWSGSRHPGFEVLVAVVVIATGMWEEFIVEATEADAALLQTNHTIILFGLIQLLKFAPHLFISLEVIGDAGRAGPGTPD